MKLAIVLFNLGGPGSQEEIEPFLFNLFRDPAILSVPGIVRIPLAWLIAKRRANVAREIYAKIGGRSPILAETEAQAQCTSKRFADARYAHLCCDALQQAVFRRYGTGRCGLETGPNCAVAALSTILHDHDGSLRSKIGGEQRRKRI